MEIKKDIDKKKIIYWFIFMMYAIVNFVLLLKHEPWRDEIHAWLMSKTYSLPELISASRFDGHPILWHLILMPFAKLNFPIITLNIISYIIILISVWILLFKTNLSTFFKAIIIFTIPFTYTFSVISRNYSLILLFFMLIATIYDKKSKHPIYYSLLIALLVHTHSLAWGIVAGLTITFHFYEIFLYIKNKSNIADIKKVCFGLLIIIISTLLVVVELFGTTNTDYGVGENSYVGYCIEIMCSIICVALIISIFNHSKYNEFIILLCGYMFQILIYTCVYSSILFQRFILIFAFLLFYILLLSKTEFEKKKLDLICIVYLAYICIFAVSPFIDNVKEDIKYSYSSAQEMAEYINNNLPENSTILIDASIIGQSIIPYLDTARFYDIAYDEYVDCANVSHDRIKIINALNNSYENYSGHYMIICNNFVTLDELVLFETSSSITNEIYTLYYIH